MRRPFFKLLHAAMAKDPRIVLLVGDLGYSLIEPIRDDFPGQFYNMQAAEFAMTGAAIGMTYSGKIPLIYSISPFVYLRNFELLRTYVNHERIPIKVVAAGRDADYKTEGISHHAFDAKAILDTLPHIRQHWPAAEVDLTDELMTSFLYDHQPAFLSLSK